MVSAESSQILYDNLRSDVAGGHSTLLMKKMPSAEKAPEGEVVEKAEADINEPTVSSAPARRKNILFLMTDDLRPQLSPYGRPVITPNFDRLAGMSATFERAYNQDPICNPSRGSLLTGRRPDTTQVWLFEATPPRDVRSLYRFLKEAGNYTLYGSGKLEHWISSGMSDFDAYWPSSTQEWNQLSDENYKRMNSSVQPDDEWPIERYLDSKVAARGIEFLEQAVSQARQPGGRPFFVGVGFHQPHRPWHFPRQFWDLYNDTFVPVTPHRNRPIDSPNLYIGDMNPNPIGIMPHNAKLYSVDPDKRESMPYEVLREQMRGYHASISFLDHQLGRLLDAFDRLGLANDTAVVFCVDHGLNVGDHGLWDKRTLLETTARVPLFVRDPSMPQSFGTRVPAIVENVDIFPTVAELAGLQREASDERGLLWPPLEGESLLPLVRSPEKAGKWKAEAVTQIARCCSECSQFEVRDVPWRFWVVCRGPHHEWPKPDGHVVMGYSLRVQDWRYNMWLNFNCTTLLPSWSEGVLVEELYDHRDPRCNEASGFDLCEDVNVEADPAHAAVKAQLRDRLIRHVQAHNRPLWMEKRAASQATARTGLRRSRR